MKHTGGREISQKWINGVFWEDEKEEDYLEGFHPSMSTVVSIFQVTAQGTCWTGPVYPPSPQHQPRCIEHTFPLIRGYMIVVQQPFSNFNTNLKMAFCYAMNPNAKEKEKKKTSK